MRNLIAVPLLGVAVILQSSVFSQIRLLSGYADLPLLILSAWALQDRVKSAWHWAALGCMLISFVSGLPWFVFVLGYMAVIWLAQALQKRVWQAPLLAMFSVTFAGTLIFHGMSFATLSIMGVPLVLEDVIGVVTLPSLLLNLLFSIPLHSMMRDLARWVYPPEEYA